MPVHESRQSSTVKADKRARHLMRQISGLPLDTQMYKIAGDSTVMEQYEPWEDEIDNISICSDPAAISRRSWEPEPLHMKPPKRKEQEEIKVSCFHESFGQFNYGSRQKKNQEKKLNNSFSGLTLDTQMYKIAGDSTVISTVKADKRARHLMRQISGLTLDTQMYKIAGDSTVISTVKADKRARHLMRQISGLTFDTQMYKIAGDSTVISTVKADKRARHLKRQISGLPLDTQMYKIAGDSTVISTVKADKRARHLMRQISGLTLDTQMYKIAGDSTVMEQYEPWEDEIDNISICSDPAAISRRSWEPEPLHMKPPKRKEQEEIKVSCFHESFGQFNYGSRQKKNQEKKLNNSFTALLKGYLTWGKKTYQPPPRKSRRHASEEGEGSTRETSETLDTSSSDINFVLGSSRRNPRLDSSNAKEKPSRRGRSVNRGRKEGAEMPRSKSRRGGRRHKNNDTPVNPHAVDLPNVLFSDRVGKKRIGCLSVMEKSTPDWSEPKKVRGRSTSAPRTGRSPSKPRQKRSSSRPSKTSELRKELGLSQRSDYEVDGRVMGTPSRRQKRERSGSTPTHGITSTYTQGRFEV